MSASSRRGPTLENLGRRGYNRLAGCGPGAARPAGDRARVRADHVSDDLVDGLFGFYAAMGIGFKRHERGRQGGSAEPVDARR